MAREGLFNLLRSRIDIESAKVIDLFSGTGFISYEFCSRGALAVIAVEQNIKCVRFIQKTSEILEMNMLTVVRADVYSFLKHNNIKAELVFADPPYDLPGIESLPDQVMESEIISEDGIFVLEHGPDRQFIHHRCFAEQRNYGKVHFSFFRNH